MSLKLFIFPGILILSLTIAFGYIRPDIYAILEQRSLEAAKQADLAKVESVEANVTALSQELLSHHETEQLVQRYLPLAIDQERAVDTVNFLAQQSGVVVTALYLKNVTPPPSAQTQPVATLGGESEDTTAAPVAAPEVPKSYLAQITVLGTYENIRGFYERLYRTDRLHQTQSLVIRRPEDRPQENLPENILEGSLAFNFQYLAPKRAGNALNQPLFQNTTLDFSAANTLADFINSPVGDLLPPPTGRPNPFAVLP